MSIIITQEIFDERVKRLVGTEYTFLDPYINAGTKIRVHHNVCGKVYEVTPANFCQGKRCLYCARKALNEGRTKNTDWFKDKVLGLVGSEYTVLGEYKRSLSKILMRHNLCGTQYWVTPAHFMTGKRCPKCAVVNSGMHRRKTAEEFQQEFVEIYGSEYTLLTPYVKATSPVKIFHAKCGSVYSKTPRIIIDEHVLCPVCSTKSIGECLVRNFLVNGKYVFESQKTFPDLIDKSFLSYDFYLPNKNILIEYQGIQHYKPREFFGVDYFQTQCKHDKQKSKYAEDHHYQLVKIPYTINNQKKVNDFLNSYLTD